MLLKQRLPVGSRQGSVMTEPAKGTLERFDPETGKSVKVRDLVGRGPTTMQILRGMHADMIKLDDALIAIERRLAKLEEIVNAD